MTMKPTRPRKEKSLPPPGTEALTPLDQDRAASLADEGGTAGAIIETQEPGGPEKDALMQKLNIGRGPHKPGRRLHLALLLSCLCSASAMNAEVLLTPHVGGAFSGDVDSSKLSYGGSLAFMNGGGGLGFAVDFGFTPKFFGDSKGSNNVTTLMGNLVLSSKGHTRIYGSGGIGLLKTRVEDTTGFFRVDSNELGFNAGAGLLIVPEGRIGFQADIRYFRNLTDPEPDDEFDVELGGLHFWRASAGLVLKF
jgi:Outer membrane protein beta-barrel domain